MNHISLFFGSEQLHLTVRVAGYIVATIMIITVMISIERAKGNGSRWLLRLLMWPLALVTVVSMVVAEEKIKGYDMTDLLIYTTWFKVACLATFWGLAQKHRWRGDH